MVEGTAREFRLRWRPTHADYEQAVNARRRATKAVWVDRGAGYTAFVLGLLAILGGDSVRGIVLAALGLAVATGLCGRAYRGLVMFPRYKAAYAYEWELTITDKGMVDITGPVRTETEWTFWKAWVPTPFGLALCTSRRGHSTLLMIARRGLVPDDDWDDLQAFIADHVGR